MLFAIVDEKCFGGVEVVLGKNMMEDFRAWLAFANGVGEENLVETLTDKVEACFAIEVFGEIFCIYHVAVAEYECAVVFVNFRKKQLVFALEIDNQRVPGITDLFVGNVSLEDCAKFVAKLGCCYFVCLEAFCKSVVVELTIWIFCRYAKFVQTFIDKVDIDCDYRSAEVEDYIFDVGH